MSILNKAITETRYLSADNYTRYRLIMRFFYINHEQINYWLNVNEVYDEVHKYIDGYTVELCYQDLKSLVDWKNLTVDLDTDNIFKLEEFKNRKFRYRMSDYAVEIERLTVMLENMDAEGSSLDIGLIGRIRSQIEEMRSISEADDSELYSWWRELSENFKRLNREYQDYMKSFSCLKREDNSTIEQFSLLKDDIIHYLRSFVKGIQKNGSVIAQELIDNTDIAEKIIRRLIDYEKSIPHISKNITYESISADIRSKYNNLYNWFNKEGDTGMEHIMNVTNSVIRSLTGYASILADNMNSMASRKKEYGIFAKMFMDCESIEDAHKLSSLIFGISNTCHIAIDSDRITESISSGVYDEPAVNLTIKPSVRTYRQKQQNSIIKNKSAEKKRLADKYIQEEAENQEEIKKLIKDGKIVMSEISMINAKTRSVLLGWISGAMNREDKNALFKTEYGWSFRIKQYDDKKITLNCVDGDLIMPAFVLEFEGVI